MDQEYAQLPSTAAPELPIIALHRELTEKSRSIMARKNHDYANGGGDPFTNFRGSSNLGIDPILGIMLRMQDKMQRIRTFVEKGTLKVVGESVEDAVLDLINYSVLMAGMIKEKNDTTN